MCTRFAVYAGPLPGQAVSVEFVEAAVVLRREPLQHVNHAADRVLHAQRGRWSAGSGEVAHVGRHVPRRHADEHEALAVQLARHAQRGHVHRCLGHAVRAGGDLARSNRHIHRKLLARPQVAVEVAHQLAPARHAHQRPQRLAQQHRAHAIDLEKAHQICLARREQRVVRHARARVVHQQVHPVHPAPTQLLHKARHPRLLPRHVQLHHLAPRAALATLLHQRTQVVPRLGGVAAGGHHRAAAREQQRRPAGAHPARAA
mmetsp:Transcript_15076/g.46916  ORF Transcript_15076/g.46916 Transcript_15076/m.46916 type:complete len:259 (+) Transcript_15076:11-787(+)